MSIVNCSSKSAITSNSGSTEFDCRLNTTLTKCTSCAVISATIPFSYYVLSEGNNVIDFVCSGQAYTYIIPAGTYNINDFMAKVQDYISNNNDSQNVAPNQTYLLTYDNPSDTITVAGQDVTKTFGFKFANYNTYYMSNAFGLEKIDYPDNTVNTITSSLSPQVSGPDTINMILSNLSFDSQNSRNSSDNFVIIPINCNYGGNIVFNNDNIEDIINFQYAQNISSLKFKFQFSNGQEISSFRGREITIRLKFFFSS